MAKTGITIPTALLAADYAAYSDEGAARKRLFHSEGLKFLKALAEEIGVAGECDIRSNKGGIAVSGEVTLHANQLYIQVYESAGRGLDILYRTCEGRKDYCGGPNQYVTMAKLKDPMHFRHFIDRCKQMAGVTAE